MTQTVKVALFRSEADHLFRLANVDYHACVGAHELRNWHTIAARVLAEVKHYECKRAHLTTASSFAGLLALLSNVSTECVGQTNSKRLTLHILAAKV